jgi:hypothetical protein
MDSIAYWFSERLIWLISNLGIYEFIGSFMEARNARLMFGYFLMILAGMTVLGISRKVGGFKKASKAFGR